MNKSMLTRAITNDGSVRVIFADMTSVVQKAHEIHNTSKTMTATLGRCLTAASMMGSLLKDKDNTLSLQFSGDGPAGKVVCISDYCGNVKGFAENPDCELPPNAKGKLDVGGSIGQGTLTVVRDLGFGEPYIGVSNIVTGEIAEDITEYYATSEQTPTVCSLGVLANTDNSCRAAGGFLLQLMPGYVEATVSVIEKNLENIEPVSSMVNKGYTAEKVFSILLNGLDFQMFDEIDVDYICNCNRESYRRGIIGIGSHEIGDIISEGNPIEIRCRYCGKTTSFDIDELREMYDIALEKENNESRDEQ